METSQTEKILKHMEAGKPITPVQALNKFGCFRLAARINDIRARGYEVSTKIIKRNGKQYAQYRM